MLFGYGGDEECMRVDEVGESERWTEGRLAAHEA